MTLLDKLYGWTVIRRARNAEARLPHDMPEAWDAVRRTRAAGGADHGRQAIRLFDLAALLDRFKPASVLELGSGTTTPMFARHVECRGAVPCVTSLEESEHWQAISRSLVPGELQARVNFQLAPRVLETWDGQRIARYDIAYDREYDLVYVDGPSGHDPDDRRPGVKLPLVDALCLIRAGVPPRVIVVDSKRHSIAFFLKHGIERQYTMALQSSLLPSWKAALHPYRHHSVFIRK